MDFSVLLLHTDGAATGGRLPGQQQPEQTWTQSTAAGIDIRWDCHCHPGLGNNHPWDWWPADRHRHHARQVHDTGMFEAVIFVFS